MAVRKRVLKYRLAVDIGKKKGTSIGKKEDARELLKRLLEDKPRTSKERERIFAVLVTGLRRAKVPAWEKDDVIKEFVRMREEIEDEERGIIKNPMLRGETEEVEKHAVRPVPKQNRGFLRENVSNNIRRYKEELKILKKHK